MEKKQATLFTFFKAGATVKPEVKAADVPESLSGPSTANTSPKSSFDQADSTEHATLAGKSKVTATKKRSPPAKNSKRKAASSSGASSSDSDSSDSDSSCSDSSSDGSRRQSPPEKRSKTETYTPLIDVDALFSCGSVSDAPLKREFETARGEAVSSDPILSTEEIDRLCKNVPMYVSQFTRFYYELSMRFDFPSWLNPKNLRDKSKRAPQEADYDVSSLLVPRKNGKVVEDGHATPMLQQYWDIKEDHFSDVILFKVGKFYELFYIDAAIAQHICQLKWMGHDRRAHVGFPETSLQHHASLLIAEGFTVCVVEQTETVSEANERSANAGRKSSGALVERKICEVFTSGTLIHEDMLKTGASHFLSAITRVGADLGVVMVDCASGKFFVGSCASVSQLKTVMHSFQPKELLFDPSQVGQELVKLFNGFKESQGGNVVLSQWKVRSGHLQLPPTVPASILDAIARNASVRSGVDQILSYLSHVMLFDQVGLCGDWALISESNRETKNMIMDSTALTHLEILRDSEQSDKGSLLRFVDRTATPFGSRRMAQLVCSPLADCESINARLDAVAFFVSRPQIRKRLEEKLKALPDLERRLQRIAAQALQQQRSAVYFGEVENKRISAFLDFLSSAKSVCSILTWLSAEPDLPPLLALLTDHNGADAIKSLCDDLRGKIEDRNGTFRPRRGAFDDYDTVVAQIDQLDQQLKTELENVRKHLGSKEAVFVNVKFRYEIEVPASLESKIRSLGDDAEITSLRKGYVRFHTEAVKGLVDKVDEAEQQLKDLLYPFMARLFAAVNEQKFAFAELIRRVADIDCLLALARVSAEGKGWTRPQFGPPGNDEGVTIKLKNSRHAIQEHLMQLERDFVPNDVFLGEQECSVMLLTGANMGGKSTMLRQVCVLIILAQMGCFVPASECFISQPVDRIFTRIGASDNILEGKSTFLTELEETAVMLRDATSRSLLVIDELGRGTSTYDGVAIAGATLEYIASKIGCNVLFATHYHVLCQHVEEYKCRRGKIGLFHMECLTSAQGKIELTHKLRSGQYPHSQAMHVAALAGIPEHIISEADSVSRDFLSR